MSGWGAVPQGGSINDYKTIGTPIDMMRVAGAGSAFALTTAVLAQGTLYALPFFAPRRGGVVDVISCYLTVAGATSNVGRLGIYAATSETNPYPAALVFGSASIDMNSPAAPSLRTSTANATLAPGAMYWMAILNSGGASGATVRGFGAVNGCIILGMSDLSATLPNVGILVTGQVASSVLPSTFPAGGTAITGTPIPGIGYHFSS